MSVLFSWLCLVLVLGQDPAPEEPSDPLAQEPVAELREIVQKLSLIHI